MTVFTDKKDNYHETHSTPWYTAWPLAHRILLYCCQISSPLYTNKISSCLNGLLMDFQNQIPPGTEPVHIYYSKKSPFETITGRLYESTTLHRLVSADMC